jgi:DNA-binding transcriptional LysR family regulator
MLRCSGEAAEAVRGGSEGAEGPRRVVVRSRLTVSTADAAISAATLGLGLTRVLSYQVAEALGDRRLVQVLAEAEAPPVPVQLVYTGQGRLPMKTRAFIDFALGRLRERLQAADDLAASTLVRPTAPVQGRRRGLQR